VRDEPDSPTVWGKVYNVRLSRFLAAFLLTAFCAVAQPIGPNAQRQIAALLAEKAARTPAQQKMDSHLVHAAKILRGEAVHPDFPKPPGEIEAVRLDARNYAEVDITADLTPDLLAFIRTLGGELVNSFAEYRSIEPVFRCSRSSALRNATRFSSVRWQIRAIPVPAAYWRIACERFCDVDGPGPTWLPQRLSGMANTRLLLAA
jgi:hypothetical protein